MRGSSTSMVVSASPAGLYMDMRYWLHIRLDRGASQKPATQKRSCSFPKQELFVPNRITPTVSYIESKGLHSLTQQPNGAAW